MKIVLIGGNPKRYSIPFHPSTKSGRILRGILSKIGLSCELADMTSNIYDIPTSEEIEELKHRFKDYQVIFLGRCVEYWLKEHFPEGTYLPHPASRRKIDLERLEYGLTSLLKEAGDWQEK